MMFGLSSFYCCLRFWLPSIRFRNIFALEAILSFAHSSYVLYCFFYYSILKLLNSFNPSTAFCFLSFFERENNICFRLLIKLPLSCFDFAVFFLCL